MASDKCHQHSFENVTAVFWWEIMWPKKRWMILSIIWHTSYALWYWLDNSVRRLLIRWKIIYRKDQSSCANKHSIKINILSMFSLTFRLLMELKTDCLIFYDRIINTCKLVIGWLLVELKTDCLIFSCNKAALKHIFPSVCLSVPLSQLFDFLTKSHRTKNCKFWPELCVSRL